MSFELLIFRFAEKAREDPRIGPSHISLFLAIMIAYRNHGFVSPVSAFGKELMKQAKISSANTYHKCIGELKEYNYLRYVPSYNPLLGSLFYIDETDSISSTKKR